MEIEFSLLSVLSVAFLLFFTLQGGTPYIYSWEVGISASEDTIRITVDPAFVVWGNPTQWTQHCGVAFGNVMVLEKSDRNTIYGEYLLNFEGNHIRQFYALGWWVYPASLFLPIDPIPPSTNWNNSAQGNEIEWLPPSWWNNYWNFITITIGPS